MSAIKEERMEKNTAYLILSNGRVYEGERFGLSEDVTAEIVFTTGMTGYLETLTDPSFHGQMIVQTFPQIGNVGVIPEDFESSGVAARAYIVSDLCGEPSNFRSAGALGDFLTQRGVAGLSGVDTRSLTRVIREQGCMNAAIVSKMPEDVPAFAKSLAAMALASDVYAVTCDKCETLGSGKRHVALWDFGYKRGIALELMKRDCRVTLCPASSTAEEIAALHPDGVLLSNGPGDPATCGDIIREVGNLSRSGVPMLGICLGHQLLAISQGGASAKLKFGHRGANQPVRECATGRLFITSQNHGYEISVLPKGARESYININDGTNEGLEYSDINAFSVQFHPEARSGPEDTAFLFDEFIKRMGA